MLRISASISADRGRDRPVTRRSVVQPPVSEDLEDEESEWNDENADDAENATPPPQLLPPVNQPDSAVRQRPLKPAPCRPMPTCPIPPSWLAVLTQHWLITGGEARLGGPCRAEIYPV